MRVGDIMVRDLLTLGPDATVADALRGAETRDVHHVLVTADDRLTGVLCVCELREAARTDPLARHLSRTPEVIAPDRDLPAAAQRFVDVGVSCLPVCAGGTLVGVITRRDVQQYLPESSQPERFACSFCGSLRHVRPMPGHGALATCLECGDRTAPATSGLYEEGGKN